MDGASGDSGERGDGREQTDGLVRGDDPQASQRQPADLLLHIFRRPALVANEDVEYFADVDRADAGRLAGVTQQNLDFAGGRLARQRRDDGLGVENAPGQALGPPATRRGRSRARVSLSGSRPRSDPIAAPIGSSGMGRMTMAWPLPRQRRGSFASVAEPPLAWRSDRPLKSPLSS